MSDNSAIDFKNLHSFYASQVLSLSHKFPSLQLRLECLAKNDDYVWFGDKESDPDVLFAVGSFSGSVSTFGEDEKALERAFDRLAVKETPRTCTFSATDAKFSDLVVRKLRDLGLTETATGGEVFQIYASKPDNPNLKGIDLSSVTPLKPEDAHEIIKFWKYARNPQTATVYVQHTINKLPSAGIRGANGELEAWAVTHMDCHIGIVHTKEEFRNKGHARKIVAYLSGELIKTGKIPHVVVSVENDPSKALFAKLGFESAGVQTVWVHAR